MAQTQSRAPVFVVSAAISLALVAGLAFVLVNTKKTPQAPAPTGFGSARTPAQVVAPSGMGYGMAMRTPSQLKAAFPVPVPPPPSWTMSEGPPDDLPLADRIVDVFPGQVKTIARPDGVQNELGGATIVDRTAYLMTSDSIRTVDLKSRESAVFAGSPGEAGCVTGLDPGRARFSGPAGDVVTDGQSLYVAGGCGIVKVDLTSGATSTIETWSGPMTLGPDGHLYVGATEDGAPIIARIDPATASAESYLSFPTESAVLGIASDAQYLWALVDEGPSAPAVLDRVTFTDGLVTRFAMSGVDGAGAGQLASAGPYLYAPEVGNMGVLRFTKQTGDWGLDVGGNEGDVDSIFNSAAFGSVTGLASDGSAIWVADSANGSLRRVTFSQVAGLQL